VLLLEQGDPGKKRTPAKMTRLLKRFRRGAPAEFIVPQSAPGALPEMRCFDLTRCRCLHYAGAEDMKGRWQWEEGGAGTSDFLGCGFVCEDGGDMGAPMTATHTTRCVVGRDSETRIDINPCTAHARRQSQDEGRLSQGLRMTYRRSILVAAQGVECRAVTQSWYEALDPGSYTGLILVGDQATRPFDVLACPCDDPACANYCRYLCGFGCLHFS